MIKVLSRRLGWVRVPILLFSVAAIGMVAPPGATGAGNSSKKLLSLGDKVRHELVMLPYFGVFDNIGFDIQDANTVVLSGQVLRPMLKSDAESAVRRIQGVNRVVNQIEVLPVSRFDDLIRLATYWAIFSRPGFEKYALQAISPIRIIVKNGNITLDGVVGSQFDKVIAAMAARSVFGVFSVTDNLKVG